MLWAFEPVKYCCAAPRLSAAPAAGPPGIRPRAARSISSRRARARARPACSSVNASITVGGAPAARMSRSPQVSQPRRRLPTTPIAASGACSRSAATSEAAVSYASAHQPPAREALRAPRAPSGSAPPSLRPCPSAARMRPSRAGRLEIVEGADAELAIEERHRSSGRRPAGAAGRGSSAEIPAAGPGDTAIAPVSTSSPILAARSLPMPGSASRSAGASAATRRDVRHGLGGIAVCANLERVLVLDLEQIADLGEHARDREVVHQECAAQASPAAVSTATRLYNASMSMRDIRRHAGQLAIAGFAGHSIPADLRGARARVRPRRHHPLRAQRRSRRNRWRRSSREAQSLAA